MTRSPIEQALGAAWAQLAPALRRHHRGGVARETGHLDVSHPARALPLLVLMRLLGALVLRRGRQVGTTVTRHQAGSRQHWHRRLVWDDGRTARFDSVWDLTADGRLVEFVNPVLGWEMAATVVDGRLHVRGLRYVAKLGHRLWTVPGWLTPGHATIVERALDEHRYAMDFRLTHPLLGEVFRYRGEFETSDAGGESSPPPDRPGASGTVGARSGRAR